jgi:hypothetical protein
MVRLRYALQVRHQEAFRRGFRLGFQQARLIGHIHWCQKAGNDLLNAVHTLTLGAACPADAAENDGAACSSHTAIVDSRAVLAFKSTEQPTSQPEFGSDSFRGNIKFL